MLQICHLNEQEIDAFACAFANYSYASEEVGMVSLFPGHPDSTRLINYLKAMIRTANDCNAIYATSKNHEGIVILTDTTDPHPNRAVFRMITGMIRALGLRNFFRVVKNFQAGGASLERVYRNAKKDFIQVELLAVREEYQGQGFMRPLMDTAKELADRKHLPLIVTTDAILKRDKYLHYGMTLVNSRSIVPNCNLYDMERLPAN